MSEEQNTVYFFISMSFQLFWDNNLAKTYSNLAQLHAFFSNYSRLLIAEHPKILANVEFKDRLPKFLEIHLEFVFVGHLENKL